MFFGGGSVFWLHPSCLLALQISAHRLASLMEVPSGSTLCQEGAPLNLCWEGTAPNSGHTQPLMGTPPPQNLALKHVCSVRSPNVEVSAASPSVLLGFPFQETRLGSSSNGAPVFMCFSRNDLLNWEEGAAEPLTAALAGRCLPLGALQTEGHRDPGP